MRVARLPLVPELGDGSLLAVRDEDRVVAESLGPARLLGDPALEHTRSAHFLAVRAEQDELADVSRPPVLDTLQIVDEPRDRAHALILAVAGRANAGSAAEGFHLDPGVLTKRPRAGGKRVGRFGTRIVVVAVASLFVIVIRIQRLELPGQERRELPELVRVPRGEDQSLQRTSRTPSTSESFATIPGASAFGGSVTSTSTILRSASWLISSDWSLAPSVSS